MADDEVLRAIPHRPPFLWVDSVLEQSDTRILTSKTIFPDEPLFQGHYPDFPLLPGVIICEAMFQSGAILLAHAAREIMETEGLVPVVTRIQDVRFKHMVRPGDELELEVEIKDSLPKLYHCVGKARVRKTRVAARGSFALALAPKPGA